MEIMLKSPLDMHVHLREGAMLRHVAPYSARHFAGGVIMPNLQEPIDSLQKVTSYKHALAKACINESFTQYMTLFFKRYSREELVEIKPHIIGVKLYPQGVTTNSQDGVTDLDNIYETLGVMEELDIPLLVHGESNGFVLEREQEFLVFLKEIITCFPSLRIVLEHITTREAIEFINRFSHVYATVTLHHLLLSLDDVVGGLMRPHLFCKPIAKWPQDRDALRSAVFSGHHRIMFGSDSAPHPRDKKECCGCAAGIFSAPIALPLLAQIFEEADCLDKLQGFTSDTAQRCYTLAPLEKTVILHDTPMRVPKAYNTIVPFYAGKTISWSIKSIIPSSCTTHKTN